MSLVAPACQSDTHVADTCEIEEDIFFLNQQIIMNGRVWLLANCRLRPDYRIRYNVGRIQCNRTFIDGQQSRAASARTPTVRRRHSLGGDRRYAGLNSPSRALFSFRSNNTLSAVCSSRQRATCTRTRK